MALLSFAVNSGLGRFSNADQLQTVFELMKDPNYDSSVVPEEFKSLVAEIESEIVLSDTERIFFNTTLMSTKVLHSQHVRLVACVRLTWAQCITLEYR
jgi:hypothetical protein